MEEIVSDFDLDYSIRFHSSSCFIFAIRMRQSLILIFNMIFIIYLIQLHDLTRIKDKVVFQ
jgi:hypothetical protein